MKKTWELKRTAQCKKCPWRKDVDPNDIPNGYDLEKHKALKDTIADPGELDLSMFNAPLRVMACHESHDAHCIGWLHNQLGAGNNIMLRLGMRDCTNIGKIRLRGKQHETFEDTIPENKHND